ncbi:MAG: hypothetical protein FJX76_12530, partial [Armatimonadetes bacterium]|nr:hypothetical protein [Armatimonadota bacterium]
MNTTIETTRTPTFAAGRPQAAAARPPVDEDKIEVGGALNPPVNEGRLLQNFLRLVQIPGNTRNERRIADTLKQDCTALGYEVFEDDAGQRIGGNAGNLIVNIPGNVPGAMPILFAAHMDTVRLAVGVRPQIRDGIISSDGTTALGGDDRAGCAEIMEAVREVTE